MTKVEAIKKVMQDHCGAANWKMIYGEIEQYYPEAKRAKDWKAGIRGAGESKKTAKCFP